MRVVVVGVGVGVAVVDGCNVVVLIKGLEEGGRGLKEKTTSRTLKEKERGREIKGYYSNSTWEVESGGMGEMRGDTEGVVLRLRPPQTLFFLIAHNSKTQNETLSHFTYSDYYSQL